MSDSNGEVKIVAVINPCLYNVVFSSLRKSSFAGLYAVIPPELKTNPNIPLQQLVAVLDQWRSYNSYIKELVSSSERIEFEQCCLVDGIPFGTFILFQKSGEHIELKKYLLQTTIGITSDNPLTDALRIKDNSLKPTDFNISLSSSDESCSPIVKEKRKSRGRASGLKKPIPLKPEVRSTKISKPSEKTFTLSQEDSSVVNAIVKSQNLPSGFHERFINSFSVTVNSNQEVSPKPVVKNTSSVKEINLNEVSSIGVTEVCEDYARRKEEWIEDLAAKHTFLKIKPIRKEMTSSIPSPPRAMGRGQFLQQLAMSLPKPEGRGQMLGTIMEKESEFLSGTGRGQYLVSSTPKTGGGGRGQWLRRVYESSNSDTPKPGPLKRVFSLDVFGGALRATAEVDEDSTSDSFTENSSVILRDNPEPMSDQPNITTSSESLNQSIENQAQVIPMANNQHEENISSNTGSDLSLLENKDKFIPEEIPRDCPVNEYMQRLIAFGGLIHGKKSVPPKTNFSEMDLHPLITESLKKKAVKDLMRCQSYSIPSVLTRRNTVIISPPRSGKTSAAIIPLLSLLGQGEFYSSLKAGCGPRAVFITSFAQSVRYTTRFITEIAPYLSVVSTYGGGLELERKEMLVNGCDIIVSTPRCWLRLLSYKWITSVNRLCHLYIDDMDTVIDLYLPELMAILKLSEALKAKREKSDPELQTVLIGESWTDQLNDIVLGRIIDPLLCMTSHLEAALYAHIKPRVHILNPDNKIDKLMELLKDKNDIPCVIVCNSSEEVNLLRNVLYTKRSKIISAHGNMSMPLFRDAHVNWQNLVKSKTSPPLMIVNDDVLCDLGIHNAKWLCHYSLPDSKTNFSYRFSTVKDNFTDRLINSQVKVPDCKIDILVDYTNEEQLPDVLAFMSRLKTQIPEELLSAIDKIKSEKEINKNSEVGFCKNLLQFGKCWRGSKCKQQHCINYSRDKPRNLPLSGYVKVMILKVHSGSHFSVRLIAHTEDPKLSYESWTEIQSPYAIVALKLNAFYSNRNNRRMHGIPQIGDLSGIEEEADTSYKRVKILQITHYDERHIPTHVKVHFIDEGTVTEMHVNKLLHLPNELKTYARTSIDLYLTGLLPVDLDKDWSEASVYNLRKKISSIQEEHIFIAKVALVMGYSILVESLKAVEMLEISKCFVTHMSVKKYLLEHNLAVKNPNHLDPLISICQEANLLISVSPYQDGKIKSSKKSLQPRKTACETLSQVMWAHLPSDEISTVRLTSAENPSLFYVCHEKFTVLLERLEKDIAEYMETNPKHIDISDITPHLVCLAKYEDRWNRGILCEDPPDVGSKEEQLKYPVLFVDYGDISYLTPSEMAHCPSKFISVLPFQGIKCELTGLNPINNEWSVDVADVLYNMTQIVDDEASSIFKNISLIVTGTVSEKSSNNLGKHYKVILIDTSNGKDVILNKEIVFGGFANWNPSEKHLLDSVDIASFQPDKYKEEDQTSVSDSTLEESKDEEDKTSSEEVVVESSCDSDSSPHQVHDDLIDLLEKFDIQSAEDSPLNFFASLRKKVLTAAGKKLDSSGGARKLGRSQVGSDGSDNDADISELEDSRSPLKPAGVDYRLKSGYLTPRIGWLQTDSYVYVRILLPGLETYSLRWSPMHFDFSAMYDGKRYRQYIDLFGAISPGKLTHALKGQYVEIKMLKVLTDFKWPRLLYDERDKPFWLQVLSEPDLKEEEDTLETCTDLGELSSKLIKMKKRKHEGEIHCYDKDDDDSDGSDIVCEELNIDPYDPLL